MRAYFHTYGLPTIVTNCSNNYGPYQFPEKLIPLMILNALEGRPLPIYGDGGNVRDWLHVDDHCAGLLLVLESGRPGEKYNIGGGNERTNLEIVDRDLRRSRRAAAGRVAIPRSRAAPELPRAQDVRPRPSGSRSAVRDRRVEDPRASSDGAAPFVRAGLRDTAQLVSRSSRLVREVCRPGATTGERLGLRRS